jgi:hypothetical protein
MLKKVQEIIYFLYSYITNYVFTCLYDPPLANFVFAHLFQPTKPDLPALPAPGGGLTWCGLPTLESLTYPGAAANPPMRILLLGAQAPSRAVGGYFSRLTEPNCTIKFLPTLESFLTYPGVAATPPCVFYYWVPRHLPGLSGGTLAGSQSPTAP